MAKKFESISWIAEEYIVKKHNALWYIGLIVVVAGLSALAIFFQGWTFLALIVLSAISLVIYTLRPARQIHYTLDSEGLTEEKNLKPFENFRAFGILKEDEHYCVVLIPKKRLGLQSKVYFPTENGEAIVDAFGMRLPMEEVKPDFLDKIVNFLRI
jgi:hypothetical protein